MTGYYFGSCLDNFKDEVYDYFFSGIPCYEDLSFFGVDVKTPESYKTKFMDLIVPMMNPRLGTATIAFTGNRRNNSIIAPKFYFVCQAFFENGYVLKDAKYIKKTDSYNAYSSTLIHAYTFQKKGMKGVHNLRKDSLYNTYGKDCWGPFKKEFLIGKEVVGMPIEIPTYHIQNFTDKGHIVYDPFVGIGSTLEAARSLDRQYLGYEIRKEIWEEGKKRFPNLISYTKQPI